MIPISAPIERLLLSFVLVGAALIGGAEDVVGNTVDDEDAVVLKSILEDKEGPTVCAILIAPCALDPQHAVLFPPQHQVLEFALPSQEVTCVFPFESYPPRINPTVPFLSHRHLLLRDKKQDETNLQQYKH